MITIRYLFAVAVLTWARESSSEREYREECQVWENVTHLLNTEANVEMKCAVNQACTGYDCNGTYNYSGGFSLYSSVSVNYCFGVAIHPCQRPTNMEFYVELLDSNSTYSANISHDDVVMIPGSNYDFQLVSIDAFVAVDMEKKTIDGQDYMMLGLTLKMRVKSVGMETWPPGMQRTLMPDANIPVPPCDSSVRTPHHVPYTCQTYIPPAPSHTTASVPQTTDNYTSIPCKKNTLYECGDYEECHYQSSTCVCMQNYIRQNGVCQYNRPTTTEILTFVIDHIPESQNNKTTFIIVGCVVSIMVVVGMLVGVVVWRYKQYQARYGQHQLLMSSDDEEPLDIAT